MFSLCIKISGNFLAYDATEKVLRFTNMTETIMF